MTNFGRALVLAAALATAAGGAFAAVGDPDVVRVNSVVVAPAASVAEAEAAAKRQALAGVLKMRGNAQIRDADAKRIMAMVGEVVTTRHVLNAQPVGGRFQPAFYFNVDMAPINTLIQQTNVTEVAAYGDPRVQVAIVIRRLPKAFANDDDREAYVGDLNETVKQYFGREGFSLVDFLNFEADLLVRTTGLQELEKLVFNPENPPTAIDYYLLGELDIPDDATSERDGGAYWRTNAKLQLKMLDLNSGQPVASRRTVEGTGASGRESIDDAINNIVKAVAEKASAPDILKTWRKNVLTGMKYEISVCEKHLKYEYFDDLLRALEGYGQLSGGKSSQVPLYVFQFPGGKFPDPAKGFENMLKDVQAKGGKYNDTRVMPIIYKKHKVFMFGNTPNCFGGGKAMEAVE